MSKAIGWIIVIALVGMWIMSMLNPVDQPSDRYDRYDEDRRCVLSGPDLC